MSRYRELNAIRRRLPGWEPYPPIDWNRDGYGYFHPHRERERHEGNSLRARRLLSRLTKDPK